MKRKNIIYYVTIGIIMFIIGFWFGGRKLGVSVEDDIGVTGSTAIVEEVVPISEANIMDESCDFDTTLTAAITKPIKTKKTLHREVKTVSDYLGWLGVGMIVFGFIVAIVASILTLVSDTFNKNGFDVCFMVFWTSELIGMLLVIMCRS